MANPNVPFMPTVEGPPAGNALANQHWPGLGVNPLAHDAPRNAAKFTTFSQLFNDETLDP
jgi:hypothetical protein